MRRSIINEARSACRGKWHLVLRNAGIEERVLNGRNQPCPMCGGVDRFRFTNYEAEGRYFCNGCGPGDGLDLMSKALGMSLGEAARRAIYIATGVPEDQIFVDKPDIEARRRALRSMWEKSAPLGDESPSREYLTKRGCYDPAADLYSDLRDGRVWHRERAATLDAMLALVRDEKGRAITIHRTYLENGKRLDRRMMPPIDELAGASIRLGEIEDRVVVGEGIETTLSGCLYFGRPGMAAISANMMQAVKVPKRARDVIILADHDRSFTGQAAAFTLARRLDNEGRLVSVVMPQFLGDFNDYQNHFHCWENRRHEDAGADRVQG